MVELLSVSPGCVDARRPRAEPSVDDATSRALAAAGQDRRSRGIRIGPLLRRGGVGGVPLPRRLVAADFVTRGKPHPEPFLTGAALLGFAPQDCVVFEDSASGAQAGRAAGCTVVATTFSHPVESLDAAHYLVEDLVGMNVTVLPGEEGLLLSFTPLAG